MLWIRHLKGMDGWVRIRRLVLAGEWRGKGSYRLPHEPSVYGNKSADMWTRRMSRDELLARAAEELGFVDGYAPTNAEDCLTVRLNTPRIALYVDHQTHSMGRRKKASFQLLAHRAQPMYP